MQVADKSLISTESVGGVDPNDPRTEEEEMLDWSHLDVYPSLHINRIVINTVEAPPARQKHSQLRYFHRGKGKVAH